jgi:hypothetical protein
MNFRNDNSTQSNTTFSTTTINNPGIYTATVTNLAGCKNTSSINIGSAPAVTLATNQNVPIFCFGNTTTISVTGATNYTWSNASNSSSIIVSPTINTTYTVVGSNGNCSGTASVSVLVNPIPTISVVSNQSLICVGQSATLVANGANTYTWNSTSVSSSIAITPSVTSIYTVSGSDNNGCTGSALYTQSVALCTGDNLNYNNEIEDLLIFPNPFSSNLTIIKPIDSDEIKIFIFNSVGQLIDDKIIYDNKTEINLNSLPNGFYFIRLKLKGEEKSIKLLKE